MKNFFNKYLFFLNLQNPSNFRDPAIFGNIVILSFFCFVYVALIFTKNNIDDLAKLYSGFLTLSLIRISILWSEIQDLKNNIDGIKNKLKERNLKYDTIEIYFVTTILTYLLIIFTLVFIIDWEIVGSQGINKSGFLGIVIVLLSIYQYRKYVKSMKKNKPAHVRKKERLEQKWWQKFFGKR